MNFWKRLNLIASAVVVVLWLAIVAASAWFGAAPATATCLTNCL